MHGNGRPLNQINIWLFLFMHTEHFTSETPFISVSHQNCLYWHRFETNKKIIPWRWFSASLIFFVAIQHHSLWIKIFYYTHIHYTFWWYDKADFRLNWNAVRVSGWLLLYKNWLLNKLWSVSCVLRGRKTKMNRNDG